MLALAGMAFILLAACYLLIDVYKVWSGTPFYYPGRSALLTEDQVLCADPM